MMKQETAICFYSVRSFLSYSGHFSDRDSDAVYLVLDGRDIEYKGVVGFDAFFASSLDVGRFYIPHADEFYILFSELVRRGVNYDDIIKPEPPKKEIFINGKPYLMSEEFLTVPSKPINKVVAKKNLNDLSVVLSRHSISHFIMYGTLLGAVREQDFISHDTDTDVGAFSHDSDKLLSLVFELDRVGLKLVRKRDRLLSFMRDGDYIDILLYKNVSLPRKGWTCCENLFVPFRFLDSLDQIHFLGRKYNVPMDSELLLTWLYGPDWRTPKEGVRAQPQKTLKSLVSSILPVALKVKIKKFCKRLFKYRYQGIVAMILVMKHLKRLAHRMFQACGYDFLRYTADNFTSLRRARILQAQKIALVLDVGASEGTYPVQLRRSGYRRRIISFEPLSESFSTLQQCAAKDPLWSCENMAVGDSDDMIEINVSGHKTSSSILPISKVHLMAMPSSVTVRKEKVKIVRLDSLLGKMFERNENIYLKIDVQGFERHVLEGARETLKQTRAIELELSLVPMYEGGPTLAEMLDYLSDLDFAMASIEPVFSDPKTGHVLQIDGIFVRPDRVLKELAT